MIYSYLYVFVLIIGQPNYHNLRHPLLAAIMTHLFTHGNSHCMMKPSYKTLLVCSIGH